MTKNATSSKMPTNLKEVEKNRRKNKNPKNDIERNFQENA